MKKQDGRFVAMVTKDLQTLNLKLALTLSLIFYYRVTHKKYSHLTKHLTIAFCSNIWIYLDFDSLLINLDFDTSTSKIR